MTVFHYIQNMSNILGNLQVGTDSQTQNVDFYDEVCLTKLNFSWFENVRFLKSPMESFKI